MTKGLHEIVNASPEDKRFLEELSTKLEDEGMPDASWYLWNRPDYYYLRGEGAQVVVFTYWDFGLPCMEVAYTSDNEVAGEAAVAVLREREEDVVIIDSPVLLPGGYQQRVLQGCSRTLEYVDIDNGRTQLAQTTCWQSTRRNQWAVDWSASNWGLPWDIRVTATI